MSKLIAQLLQADPRNLSAVIKRLEHICLQPGVDAKLTTEIIVGTREKIRLLGLDPTDSTLGETYYGLIAKARCDDTDLRKKIGISESSPAHVATEKIAKNSKKLLENDTVVCMTPSAVKRLLGAVPPKKTLRILRFRSIGSVLKREDPYILYALATILEDSSWKSQVKARLKRLQPREAKESQVQVLSLPDGWQEKLEKTHFASFVAPVAEIGSVLILPAIPLSAPGSLLLTLCLVLQSGERLAAESLAYRTRALTTSYEKLLPDIAASNPTKLQSVHGLQPNWSSVYRLLSETKRDNSLEFEFMLNNLKRKSLELKLGSLCSELDFWINSHFLGFIAHDKPVSLNVVDIATSLVLEKEYGSQVYSNLQISLWSELQLNYLKQEKIEREVISQLTSAQEIMV